MTKDLRPDPSMIGGIAKVPLVRLPDPVALFQTRASRFAYLAEGSAHLGPYLRFLSGICAAQAGLAADLNPLPAPAADWVALARESRMPQIDRHHLRAMMPEMLELFLPRLDGLAMPEAARLALDAVKAASADERNWLFANVLADRIPEDSVAPHLFVAAAVQLHAARHAAALDPEQLVPIKTGTCPACGGRPAVSMVTENMGAEGTRYAACACCQTLWNEVRIKCLCCGDNAKISYRAVEADDAVIKAEICGSCDHWVKILYQNKNPTLEPIADDVASLGLDLKMKETGLQRGGFNPFLMGF
ncbi:formate dehydrogenase accessory protein FdhE [Paracoccus aminophilus]|uniref:Formate dehydrogenase accessory protein FdhE n=1 Tax=Paracoccus aminophilus JCM 7686 TaxID=1367847 RepID=S5YZ83_PARAH|nr:formate dehydrogenase accessory protein FdhE [Paracoccus aminophilus]AGT10511.1 formate dehydrogenase accessory protein FdhE [Paracoccus aminophilus JCM 7686]